MENQIKFIERYVFPKIIAENKVLNDMKFIRSSISDGNSIDGFMGNIIFATLVFETKDQKLEASSLRQIYDTNTNSVLH